MEKCRITDKHIVIYLTQKLNSAPVSVEFLARKEIADETRSSLASTNRDEP